MENKQIKVIITGGPGSGKTTLAKKLSTQFGIEMKSTDDVMNMDWHDQSAHVASWFNKETSLIIEGVASPRALRKWLLANPDKSDKPADYIIHLKKSHKTLSTGQTGMTKSHNTVWKEIESELLKRNVKIIEDVSEIEKLLEKKL